jgi:cell division protein FtsL
MTTKPDIVTNKTEDNESHSAITQPAELKRQIYPEVNSKFTGMLKWFALAFVVMVLIVQYFSGYN